MKQPKRPEDVPEHARLLPDGRWVDGDYDAKGRPQNGWRYYDASGETVEVAFFDKGVCYKSYRYFSEGHAALEFSERRGEIRRSSSRKNGSVQIAADLPAFPTRETMIVRFTMKDVDVEKRTFTIGNVTYFDENEKQLDKAGGAGAPPVAGAVLVKTKNDRAWCSAPRGNSGVWRYFEVDGSPSFEVELDKGRLVAVGQLVEQSWVRQRFLPSPALITNKLTLEHRSDKHVLTARGKTRTFAPSSTNVASLVKEASSFFEPVLKSSGVRVRFGKHTVTRFTHIAARKPFAVACIAEVSGGDEYVVVLEPGPFEGQVFLNFHEEGLFSVDSLNEWVKEVLPELLGKKETVASVLADRTRLIALAPFVQHPIAPSFNVFFAGLRGELAEDWYKRLKPFSGKALPQPPQPSRTTASTRSETPTRVKATAKKAAAKKATAKKKSVRARS